MEFKLNNVLQGVQHLLAEIESSGSSSSAATKYLTNFLQKDFQQNEKDIEQLLTFLSDGLMVSSLTVPIALSFKDCLLLLITNSIGNVNYDCTDNIDEENFWNYQWAAIALSKLMQMSLCAKSYALSYFSNKPPIFQRTPPASKSSKRIKKEHQIYASDLDIVKCCYFLLKSNAAFFKELWNWSGFLDSYGDMAHNDNSILKLYINQTLGLLTNMSSIMLRKLNTGLSEELYIEFLNEQKSMKRSIEYPFDTITTIPEKTLTVQIYSSMVTNVEGVILPIFNKANYEFYSKTDGAHDKIVRVDSTKVNLRSIALGTTVGRAICLAGPVGCGKTTLVEYLARKTGRVCPKFHEMEIEKQSKEICKENKTQNRNTRKLDYKRKLESGISEEDFKKAPCEKSLENGFLRVQLGDQTDCKMLLGQYHCTDVPGEFIWLPGVLTQAVLNGYWLLLEDLDSATVDTFTVLSGLLENQYLSVPGFRDYVKAAPGFQLFVTIRTNRNSSNSSQKSLISLLEKYLYTINILPLSRNELCKVVSLNYTKLATVANRIVDVFLTFSKGDHDIADHLRQQETEDRAITTENYLQLPHEEVNLTSVSNSGRLVSTRDLIKLCQRSNPVFSVTSVECAYFVFQNAVDIFCMYLPDSLQKTKLIASIGAKLGIIQSRCEHYALEYKPDVQFSNERIKVGRVELNSRYTENHTSPLKERVTEQAIKRLKLANGEEKIIQPSGKKSIIFSFTRLAACLLERVAVSLGNAEPILLVGETGVGKTSSVQFLAEKTKHKLVVINMNNQSDVTDLVGGFKPVEMSCVIGPLRSKFELLFRKTFNQIKNETFLTNFSVCYNQGHFSVIVKLMLNIVQKVFAKSERNELREQDVALLPLWEDLSVKLQKVNNQLEKSINISFAFIAGSLVNCIKNGDWVLLDEINLASAETLECLSTILEPEGSVVLLEKGDFTPVKRHPDFRIFACMNPNTDIGKKDLSVGIRNRFTEFFVDEVSTDADLSLLISDYLSATGIQKKSVTNIVKLYKRLKNLAKLDLNDGLGNRPVYSLRTLCRSLCICAKNLCGSIERNLYESFCLSFLTQLDPQSHNVVEHLIKEALLSNSKAVLNQAIPKPGENFLNFEGYWIQKGPKELEECSNYILTDSVKANLRDLSRIISIGKLPILLQGPTSAGKTSLIDYVARRSGNHCLRINNHEHTDLQEYIGTYTADATGKLTFREGILVQAMRNGYWIILDELNLASTEILEALNRVLDDNRELFIPENQTVVKAHSNFMLFATQNPPGLYGGRKTLSRAFKNRFIELHFSEIPRNELEIILEKKCLIPPSYARKMVSCMMDLQKNRKTTSKNIFTLRDLFRWGLRYTLADKKLLDDIKYDWNQHLIEEGYLVLSAKVRTCTEIEIIEEALYKNFKKRIDLSVLFDAANSSTPKSPVTKDIIEAIQKFKHRSDIVWTRNMSKMAVLTAKALKFNEPVLLVGPTGCGKTTICQIMAAIQGVKLRILNCHMHTEGADFLGGLRPCRKQNDSNDNSTNPKLFEWTDGPLIESMLEGSYFMADEISLAEDSVLERLNCVLEPDRTVLLSEKGGLSNSNPDTEVLREFEVTAQKGFQFLATMNPGGDFGKRELSPALRNRFTEIWCEPSDSREDLIKIASNCMMNEQHNVDLQTGDVLQISTFIVDVVMYIKECIDKFKFSVRDILAMANFFVRNSTLSFPEKAIYGLETIFLDSLEMLSNESLYKVDTLRANITDFAVKLACNTLNENFSLEELRCKRGKHIEFTDDYKFGIKPFFISTNMKYQAANCNSNGEFLFEAPTTNQNLFRLLAALSLQKPVLLEGPPGVGKTSIVENLAQVIGYNIVRINLCEHTDLADLFGTDLPAEDTILNSMPENAEQSNLNSSQSGSFVWRDGPLLAALKADHTWILLDELNLAPQSVLEGLNAILDHRGEVYIPELNKTFPLNSRTRIFASQNPLKQGGGRKGLPQSFINRFTKVYVRKLTTEDLMFVVDASYIDKFDCLKRQLMKSSLSCDLEGNLFDMYRALKNSQGKYLPKQQCNADSKCTFDLTSRMVKFSDFLDRGISSLEYGYKGGPYEINLRDILRWCDLLVNPKTKYIPQKLSFAQNFENFLLVVYERMKLVYYQRMRCERDKQFIRNTFANVFQCDVDQLNAISEDISLYWTDEKIYLNDIVLDRDPNPQQSIKSLDYAPFLLSSQRETLKNLIECIHLEKPVLLCGSSDTGKTKVIDVLCCLSNRKCNTDNIDDSVTGSFQQIDLNRHLEEIAQQVEAIYLLYIQNALIDKGCNKTKIMKSFDAWNSFCIISNSKCDFQSKTVVSQELINFRKRISKLSITIDVLLRNISPSQDVKDNLKRLRQSLRFLNLHVENTDTLNTGGHFEWVDSQIVKSLKCGQYISLEHVNLCSSAVLDRLNPVFEPNGTLMISEKGVSTVSSSTEIVHKAKNFRAFLTIDPKNGELSRAMRNRCIELALTGKCVSDMDDKRMLVYCQGIHDIKAVNSIIAIHDLACALSEIHNFTVSHLTQTAFLVAAYSRIGYQMHKAIYVSAMEMYVYSSHVDMLGYGLDYYQNKLREVVTDECQKFENLNRVQSQVGDLLMNAFANCNELNDISMVKLQILPLKIVLSSIKKEAPQVGDNLSEYLYGFKSVDLTKVDTNVLLKYLIYIVYESSTINDLKVRYLLLSEVFKDHFEYMELSRSLYNSNKEFAKTLQENSVPVNLPWNHKLFSRIRDYTSESLEYLENNVFTVSTALLMNTLLNNIPRQGIGKLSNIDAITYSQAVAERKIINKLNNEFLGSFSDFVQSLEIILKQSLRQAKISMESFIDLITSVQWFNRILNASKINVFINKEPNPDLMDQLVLHFKWIDKHLVKRLQYILLSGQIQFNASDFERSLATLNSYVLNITHPLNITRKIFAKQIMQFQPFYREEQIKIFVLAQQMDQLLELLPKYGNFSADTVSMKLLALKSDNCRKVRGLVQNFYKIQYFAKCKSIRLATQFECLLPADLQQCLQQFVNNVEGETNFDGVENVDDLLEIEKGLNELAQAFNIEKLDEIQIEPSLRCHSEIELLLLIIREYFLIKHVTSSLQNTTLNEVYPIHMEYQMEVFSLSNSSRALLNFMQSSDYKAYSDLMRKLNKYHVAHSGGMNDLFKYLNGGYKVISSIQRLLNNSLTELHLGSLCSRDDFVNTLRNNEDISSISTYSGPSLLNCIFNTLFSMDGSFKSISIKDLDLWRLSLTTLNQILWHNATMTTPTFDNSNNNLISAIGSARRLIREVEYVKEFCNCQKPNDASNHMEGFEKLLSKLKEQVLKIDTTFIKDKYDNHTSIAKQKYAFDASLLNTLIGSVEICLLTFTPLIDPVEKTRLKQNYLMEDIQCLSSMTKAFECMRISMKYNHFGHEIYETILKRLQEYGEKQCKFEDRVALRPGKCLYSSLVRDLTHFIKTNCDPDVLLNMLDNIYITWSQMTNVGSHTKETVGKAVDYCAEVIKKLDMWIANSQRFMYHTMKPYYAYYQDFLQPIQCCVSQLRFGFTGLKKILVQVQKSIVFVNGDIVDINENGKLHKVLHNIIAFPAVTHLTIFNVASSQDILQNRSPIFSVISNVPGADNMYFCLLKAKLVELKNRLSVSHQITQEIYQEFDFAFNIINQIWQREEERRLQRKKEEDSLYQTKTKCQDENEEAKELEEIEAVFPTGIEDDFAEFVQEVTLERVMQMNKTKKTKDMTVVVKDEDYSFIANTFSAILINYTQSSYYSHVAAPNKLQFVDYFKMRTSVFARLFQYYKGSLNEYLDAECFNSMCLNVSLLGDIIQESSKCNKDKLYNFYKDSNVAEIMNCTGVLGDIERRVDEQLSLYPDHATLHDINNIIKRIRLLPATASVVRFNTGFQLLRQKVAQWNEVAHKNNHLKAEEQQLAEYVQRWTRLELQFWRNCMSHTQEKVESSALRYWFFIYNLFQEYLRNMEINDLYNDIHYAEKRFEELNTQDEYPNQRKRTKVELEDILKILRQFVESSCYGDYEVRMQLLLSFELYLQNSIRYTQDDAANATKNNLIAGLHNLQLYFAQFAKEIAEYKKSVKTPIEKKLKELVKIESYNKDLSYFSMRNNVARVHRNLNKFLKEYEQRLKEKITAVFQPKDCTVSDYYFVNDKGKNLRNDSTIKYCQVDVKCFIVQHKPESQLNPNQSHNITKDSQSLLDNIGRLFNTSRNVVKETVSKASYPKLIITLDTLLTQQLERCEHLRNLTVDRSKERKKQKLEAKQILQQKRKGLTDLFKILSILGLNYKTGLMELSIQSEFGDLTLPPFCIKTMLSHLVGKRLQPQLMQLNENIHVYFNKCVFKLKLFQNIMLTPLAELGPPNIERMKGFAIDFFMLVQNQRRLLSVSTQNVHDVHRILKQIKDLESVASADKVDIDVTRTDFNHFHDIYNVICKILSKVQYVFEQFKLMLSCVPEKQLPENCLFKEEPARLCLLVQNSSLCQTVSNYCVNILNLTKSTLGDMKKNNSEFPCKAKINRYQNLFNQLEEQLQNLIDCFKVSDNEFLPIANPLLELQSYMVEAVALIKCHSESDVMATKADFENINVELENVIHSMLIAMQKLYKKYSSKTSTEKGTSFSKTKPREEATTDHDIEEQHLKTLIYEELKDDFHLLNINQINEKLSNILILVKLSQPSLKKIQCIRKLVKIKPLLEQFSLMSEYYTVQQLAAHKISVKMLSVILTVFVEIGTKGFCVPQDLMHDEEGEKKKDQKEGEGFGLEDGSGEKDASDKIESEDQLEDAKRPEDRKDDKDDQEDCKEEKGIEMSEDFEAKSQNLDKPEEDDSGDSEDDEELNKEMGETEEGADKLDDQIWGEDEEKPETEEEDLENEEDGKGSNEEKDLHNNIESKNEKSDENKNETEDNALDATSDADQQKHKPEKDIDNMRETDEIDDQVNPYHNELEAPPEPEDIDLGDLNVDEKEENEEVQTGEDNPFDIDNMKENMPDTENIKEDDNGDEDGKENDENNKSENMESDTDTDTDGDDSKIKEDEEESLKLDDNEKDSTQEDQLDDTDRQTRAEQAEEQEKDVEDENKEEEHKEKPENYEQSKDKQSKEENMQSVPDNEVTGTKDQLEIDQTDKDVRQEEAMDEQDTGEEKEGVGQAENETTEKGHQGIADTKETTTNEDRKNEMDTKEKRKQGKTNEDRTLGDAEKSKVKQLKTNNKLDEEKMEDQKTDTDKNDEKDADEYQHVKEAKNSDKTTVDNATEEQSKKLQHLEDEANDDDQSHENSDLEETPVPDETETNESIEKLTGEKNDNNSEKPSKSDKTNERAETQEEMEIEGDIVPTYNVPRSEDTTAHCNRDLLAYDNSYVEDLTVAEKLELRKLYHQQVTTQKPCGTQDESFETWQQISNRMLQNARDLCEQLRLILEPTKCTRLKGDYRTGRRINMRKIIPYIASQFRKDKIWLRRTKAAQRDYKITIAIDDSKSMHHNNSKILTLEAISLVSQALTLLESGRLSVVSFGEKPNILLNHTEQFDGQKLVNSLQFSQDKTKIAELLDFIRAVNAEEGSSSSSDNGIFENLLLVLSDGRNIYSEGKMKVKNAIKLARLQRVFLVYIIIDNPESKNSILDIQTMEMLPDNRVNIKSYLDDFPFPYYVIVRDLNQLPLVLSEAMRQWFELVNSEQ